MVEQNLEEEDSLILGFMALSIACLAKAKPSSRAQVASLRAAGGFLEGEFGLP
jgi:hypothetical protein